MAQVVNLDALIPREDFLATEGLDAGLEGKREASRTDLTKGESFYLTLRKPDFQRETAAWSPEAVKDFIQAFIDGDLIPAVICWQSAARLTFVIDGAHRLSAIMAWIQDDYGDKAESLKFYNNKIPIEQTRIAVETRKLVDKEIGPFRDYKQETEAPGSFPGLTARARALGNRVIPLLWVKGQDSTKAESAFITINRAAVEIDPTELKILNARFRPEAIAARAIVRNSTGYQYWKDFSPAMRGEFEELARSINKLLYVPILDPTERTNELPIAGHGYGSQTLPLVFDFVNLANGLPVVDASKIKKIKPQERTIADEGVSLQFMREADKLARRMTGKHASSLGLLPAIYFYSERGRHQPTSVLAMAAFLMQLGSTEEMIAFTKVREAFEQFLIENKSFVQQLTVQHGSMAKGYRQQKEYLLYVLRAIQGGATSTEVLSRLKEVQKYAKLVKDRPTLTEKSKDFSRNLKDWSFIKHALEMARICDLCGARVDNKSMQLGHLTDVNAGGLGSGDNAAWEHPFCNSTYKPHLQKTGEWDERKGELRQGYGQIAES